MNKEELYTEIKQLIIDALNLEDFTIEDIDTEAPLFVEGLGLDSIDALELGLAVKNKFNINLEADNDEMKQHFYSVKTLADFIEAKTQA